MRYRYLDDFLRGISLFAIFSYGIAVLGTPQCPPLLQSPEACFREQSKFFKSGNLFVIDELSIYKWAEPWNIKRRFPESWGLRASVSSSPLPLPLPFFCSRSNFRAITRLEMLATQATAVYILSQALDGLWRENRGSVNRLKIRASMR